MTWQPTPVFLPGDSHGQRSLAGYSPRGPKESDTTEVTWRAHTYIMLVTVVDIYLVLTKCPKCHLKLVTCIISVSITILCYELLFYRCRVLINCSPSYSWHPVELEFEFAQDKQVKDKFSSSKTEKKRRKQKYGCK